jgi:rhamnose utilization protein RhaD (predicted bifunctional aldolase and dehydrogenase)
MLDALRALSASLGADPLLVQAAGGNTSLKQDGVMWIKASGTWLQEAESRDIFVPLNLAPLREALKRQDPACESCLDFVRQDLNRLGLRPSIETSVHGLMPQRVVLHVHCVNTIAWAIQQGAAQLLHTRLESFNWAFVPYARPGLQLCQAIQSALRDGVDVLVLQNHGLVVAADDVDAANDLLRRVVDVLKRPAREARPPDMQRLLEVASGTHYRPAQDAAAHGFAFDAWALQHGGQHVYYPDHVVFLGTSIPSDVASGAAAVAVPAAGVLVHGSAKTSVEPMLRCLSDVFARIEAGTNLRYLNEREIDALVNWDAEKYRQGLAAQ